MDKNYRAWIEELKEFFLAWETEDQGPVLADPPFSPAPKGEPLSPEPWLVSERPDAE